MNCVYLNKVINCNFVIFIFCMTGSLHSIKIYHFIQDEIPFFLKSDSCNTEICQQDAQRILSSLNNSVDPCDDFYEFACGRWQQTNKRPSSEAIWGQWEVASKTVEQNMQGILDDRTKSDFKAINDARIMYSACLNDDDIEVESNYIMTKLLRRFGGWPILDKTWLPNELNFWPYQVAKINSFLNVHPFLNFHVSINLYNTLQHVLYLDHPSFLFPKHILSETISYEKHLKAYELYIINCAMELSDFNETNVNYKRIKKEAFEIVKLETKLVKLMTWNENISNVTHAYKRISIDHLQFLTDLIPLRQEKFHVCWLDLFKVFFENTNVTLSSKDYIIVKDITYVLNLIKFLQRVPERIIANYLGWSIIKVFARDGTKNLQKFSFAMEQILNGVNEDVPRKKYCLSVVNNNFGLAIAHEYVDIYFDLKIKNEVEQMVETIKTILIKKLHSLNWMDDSTKANAIDKAKEIDILVGYSEITKNSSYLQSYYKSLQVTKYHMLNVIAGYEFKKGLEISKLKLPVENEKWSGLPTDVNAYYNVLQNVIVFPSGILQFPFYSSKRLRSLNYGAIGTIIGHELSHAFDNTGRQADKHGNFVQWWSEQSLNQYQENIKCFQEHYHKYTVDVLNKENIQDAPVNIHRTQDENVADLIGLDLAYTAYKNTKKIDEQKLPGLENYTSEQYFFLSYANQWCEGTSPEQLVTDIAGGDHTPARIRVTGALASSQPFHRAFHCPLHSPMNPTSKCTIW